VKCLVRDKGRFPVSEFAAFFEDGRLELLEGDMLVPESLPKEFGEVNAAYYLLHSMGAGKGFEEREETCARNFREWVAGSCQRVIYLGGLVPEGVLSHHLESRENVNRILRGGGVPVTTLRASIIVGSGSASFEISGDKLIQTATFRPRGLFGRAYWYSVFPFHLLLFPAMARRLASGACGLEKGI